MTGKEQKEIKSKENIINVARRVFFRSFRERASSNTISVSWKESFYIYMQKTTGYHSLIRRRRIHRDTRRTVVSGLADYLSSRDSALRM